MIEITYKENEKIVLPKNIRQVGSPQGRHKIYIEEYVYTFLRSMAQEKWKSAAVLLGKSSISKDIRYTFISGAIQCGQAVFQYEDMILDESFWEYIAAEGKEYFPDNIIVGWFIGEQGEGARLSTTVERAHRKYFAGRDKVLMLLDAKEDEEQFYIYEQGYLQKREGYYIYFEKNLAMQEYMAKKRSEQLQIQLIQEEKEKECSEWENLHREIQEKFPVEEEPAKTEKIEKKEEESATEKIFTKSSLEEPISEAEKALQNYRNTMLEKREKRVERQNKGFLYTAVSLSMIALCLVGITTFNNYWKMKEVEETLYGMKGEHKEETASDLVVESIASQVTPLEENQNTTDVQQGAMENQPAAGGQQQPEGTGSIQQTEMMNNQQQIADTQQQIADTQQQTAGAQQQTAEPQQQVAEPRYYTVQPGDTLESICLKIYQDKNMAAALCQANGIEDGNRIQAGQQLLLP